MTAGSIRIERRSEAPPSRLPVTGPSREPCPSIHLYLNVSARNSIERLSRLELKDLGFECPQIDDTDPVETRHVSGALPGVEDESPTVTLDRTAMRVAV